MHSLISPQLGQSCNPVVSSELAFVLAPEQKRLKCKTLKAFEKRLKSQTDFCTDSWKKIEIKTSHKWSAQ